MLNYLEFINENRQDESIVINFLDLILAFSFENDWFRHHYMELAAETTMGPRKEVLDSKKVDSRVLELKEYLTKNGFDMNNISKMLENDHKMIILNGDDYTHQIKGKKYEEHWRMYSGYLDIIFHEASNGEFKLAGYVLNPETNDEIENDLLVKYSYGWHKHKYGKLIIDQQFEDVPSFISQTISYAYKDMDVNQSIPTNAVDEVNEHYFIVRRHNDYMNFDYGDYPFRRDIFYQFKINNDLHVITYVKDYAENLENFDLVYNSMIADDVGELSKSRWPQEFIDTLDQTKYKQLLRSSGGINKFKLQ